MTTKLFIFLTITKNHITIHKHHRITCIKYKNLKINTIFNINYPVTH